MTQYPKHLTGTSPLGSGGVRALQSRGGDFQRCRIDTNTLSIKQGEFSKVITEGVEYISRGLVNADTIKTFSLQKYQFPALPALPGTALENTGGGKYAGWGSYGGNSVTENFSYVVYAGGATLFGWSRVTQDGTVYTSSFYGGAQNLLGGITIEFFEPSGYTGLVNLAPDLAFIGNTSGPADKLILTPGLVDNGRSDGSGRTLHDVALFWWYLNQPSFGVALPTAAFTRIDAEFSPFILPIATEHNALAIFGEQFFANEVVDVGRDYRPKFWAAIAIGKDPDMVTAVDLTTDLFPDGTLPNPSNGGSPVEDYYAPLSGANYNALLNGTMGTMISVVLPGDVALLFYRQTCGAYPGSLRFRVGRIQYTGFASLSLPIDEVSNGFVQSVVHLGNGWVLAKRVSAFSGIDKDVQFMRSEDGGNTWTTFSPAGFSATLKNQFFGNLIVHRARGVSGPGIVLIPAWDTENQAYHVYSSSDDGSTWKRRGRIYKPDTFRRVDTMLNGDGGGNFDTLVPGPNPDREVDNTITGRYATP